MSVAHKGSDGSCAGLFLSTSATAGAGNQRDIGVHNIPSDIGRRYRVFSDGFGYTASGANGAELSSANPGLRFLRWRKQAGLYYTAWSGDPEGLMWYEESTTLYAPMTPTHFSFGMNNYTGATLRCAVSYLRYYASGTQLLSGKLRTVYG
jgi:hypothetical protein